MTNSAPAPANDRPTMIMKKEQFYLYYCPHKLNHLGNTPRARPLSRFALPKGSVYHHMPASELEIAPSQNDVMIQGPWSHKYISHVTELTDTPVGGPRTLTVSVHPLLTRYRMLNREMSNAVRIDTIIRNDLNLLVYGYGILHRHYTYAAGPLKLYHTWKNIRYTIVDKIKQSMLETGRNQFILINLPEKMPTYQQIKVTQSAPSRQHLSYFETNDALDVLDLLAWAGRNRNYSTLSRLSTSELDKVFVTVMEGSKVVVLRLSDIEAWREERGEDDDYVEKKLYTYLMNFYESAHTETGHDEPMSEETEIVKVLDDESAGGEDGLVAKSVIEEDQDTSDELTVDEAGELVDDDGNIIAPEKRNSEHISGHYEGDSIEAPIIRIADEMASRGDISHARYKMIAERAASYRKLPNPFGQGTFAQAMASDPATQVIKEDDIFPDNDRVHDKSMLKSTTGTFIRQYIEQTLRSDQLRMTAHIQRAGVAVTGYRVETVRNAVDDYEIHYITVQPVNGEQSTIPIQLPRLRKDGRFMVNGSLFFLKDQRVDLPIRKVSPTQVALSNSLDKLFVNRSGRSQFDYSKWITRTIRKIAISPDDDRIKKISFSSSITSEHKIPLIYAIIGESIASLTLPNMTLWFNYSRRNVQFSEEEIERHEGGKYRSVLVGRTTEGKLVVVDNTDTFYVVNEDGSEVPIGTIEDVVGIAESGNVPMAEMSVKGRDIPIGVILAYLLGFDNLIKRIGSKYRVAKAGERLNLSRTEFAVKFADVTYIFDRCDEKTALVMNGFNYIRRTISNYPSNLFNQRDVYLPALEPFDIRSSALRELELMDTLFIDPITYDVLVMMKEPTNFVDLIIRSIEMLADMHVPVVNESNPGVVDLLQRIRGNERFAVAIYATLYKALRTYSRTSATGTGKLSAPPMEAWLRIMDDTSKEMVQEINPVQAVKEQEVVTYSGTGGRSRRSMVASTREFKDEDEGNISEATVDSADVGVTVYKPFNSCTTTVRGTGRNFDSTKDGASSLLSTASMLTLFNYCDDPKRVSFVNVQMSHVLACEGYKVLPATTGADVVIAHRTSKRFAFPAEKNGVVEHVDGKSMRVRYEDGTVDSVQLGTTYGRSSGLVLPHQMVPYGLKAGDTFVKGRILAYHPGFFEPAVGVPGQVAWKSGICARVGFMEAPYTLEDSCAIDDDMAEDLATSITEPKIIMTTAEKVVKNLADVGDHVNMDTILCVLEDASYASSDFFDEPTADQLAAMQAQSPRAGHHGVIEKIEVFYNCELDDMSESLAELANRCDRENLKLARNMGEPPITGKVGQGFRIQGNGLMPGEVAIVVYITHRVGTDIGDKLVYCNQLKSVIGERLVGVNETESGERLNSIFGWLSVMDRIVNSVVYIGIVNTIVIEEQHNIALEFFETA